MSHVSLRSTSMKATAPKSGDGRRRNNRDPEDLEDEDMSRNPRDFPFPTFAPSDAEVLRRKKEALRDIKDMVAGFVPVVPFSKPDFASARPPWSGTTVVKKSYEPTLDLLSRTDAAREPTPPLSQPKWVTYIPRVVSGCPQLGLVMVNEVDASRRAPKRVRKLRQAPPDVDPVEEASKPQRIEQLQQTCATPRFGHMTKQDFTVELLRDRIVYEAIQKEVLAQRKHDRPKNILVSLPKIGVRLFSVERGESQTARGPAHGRSLEM
jgi:hypothetical protein